MTASPNENKLPDIRQTQLFNAPIEKVWTAVATAEGIAVSHICESGGGATALMRWDLGAEIGWGEDQDIWHPKHFARMRDALQAVR